MEPPAGSRIAGVLAVIGADVLAFKGPAGGPFDPAKSSLAVKATGAGFHWSVDGTLPNWLEVSPSGGDLASDASADVAVALTRAAQSLAPGRYDARIVFKNHESNATVARGVNRVVQEPAEAPLSLERERAMKPKEIF
jgi:hypothetical protein